MEDRKSKKGAACVATALCEPAYCRAASRGRRAKLQGKGTIPPKTPGARQKWQYRREFSRLMGRVRSGGPKRRVVVAGGGLWRRSAQAGWYSKLGSRAAHHGSQPDLALDPRTWIVDGRPSSVVACLSCGHRTAATAMGTGRCRPHHLEPAPNLATHPCWATSRGLAAAMPTQTDGLDQSPLPPDPLA
jgi:hypothetical protein